LGADIGEADLAAQIAAARKRHQVKRDRGLVAVAASYDAERDRVVIEMSSGLQLAVPVKLITDLNGATRAQLASVTVDELGDGLHWRSLDVAVSVLGLLYKHLGYTAVKRASAAAGGRRSSEAKAAAARENGKRGGRPRRTAKP
jgi:hypothetical protein